MRLVLLANVNKSIQVLEKKKIRSSLSSSVGFSRSLHWA